MLYNMLTYSVSPFLLFLCTLRLKTFDTLSAFLILYHISRTNGVMDWTMANILETVRTKKLIIVFEVF